MKRYFALPVAIATLTLTAVAVAPAQAASPVATVQTEVSTGSLLEQARDLLGADVVDAATAASERLGLEESPVTQGAILKAIDPDDYECSPTSPLTDWLAGTITDWTQMDKVFALAAAQTNLAGYASMITPSDSRYGPNGEFSTAITHTFKDLRRFWDIESGDIRLAPMHSAILADRTAVYNTFRTVFHRSEADSAYFADLFSTWAAQPKFTNHPLNSMNAYAFTGEGDPDPVLAALPDQIVMGDGILQGFQAIGLADAAPQAILAHEFGHHVQYEDGLFTTELTGPEATRRTELMADAFAAYFLSHSRGASMQWKRVRLFTQVFAGIGDCGFTDPGHHGTPNQRLRAAGWGYQVADTAANQGHVLPSLAFAGLFDRQLPTLVAPDAN